MRTTASFRIAMVLNLATAFGPRTGACQASSVRRVAVVTTLLHADCRRAPVRAGLAVRALGSGRVRVHLRDFQDYRARAPEFSAFRVERRIDLTVTSPPPSSDFSACARDVVLELSGLAPGLYRIFAHLDVASARNEPRHVDADVRVR